MTRVPTRVWRSVVAVGMLAILVGLPATAVNAGGVIQPPGLDHLNCYVALPITGDPYEFPRGRRVELTDQFGVRRMVVAQTPNRLCNPVNKILPVGQQFPPANPDAHLVCFKVKEPAFVPRDVTVQNQFGSARLTVLSTVQLCAPSWKQLNPEFPPPEEPPGLDHFLCYSIRYSTVVVDKFEAVPPFVTLIDQFQTSQNQIGLPTTLCNPVQKRILDHVSQVTNPPAHLVCFKTTNPFTALAPFTKNQFGQAQLNVTQVSVLCLPSFKQEVPT